MLNVITLNAVELCAIILSVVKLCNNMLSVIKVNAVFGVIMMNFVTPSVITLFVIEPNVTIQNVVALQQHFKIFINLNFILACKASI